MDRKTYIKQQAKIELARRHFFDYCNVMAPEFYKKERQYLVDLCNELEDFETSEYDVLVINEPPRHGKSRTASMYTPWRLGRNPNLKIMTGSYNETLSTMFSKNVRNSIQELKADENKIVFSDVFPGVEIKQGDGAMNLWSLNGGYNNYLATSPTGTATGFGADLILIDDLIKNAEEANNAMVLEKHWDWFVNTMLSRLESGGKIIIIMTRWHSNDLAGKALKELVETGYNIKHVSMKAYDEETDTMLCDDVLSKDEYMRKVKTMGADIASANYQQEPIDLKGRLYPNGFKTYKFSEPPEFKRISNYTDTADTGADFLCSIVYGEYEGKAYLLDVLYTKEDMSVTEDKQARQLFDYKVNVARIESNNGGRGYERQVKKILKYEYGSTRTVFRGFHQSKNKQARILSNATWLEENFIVPDDWKIRFPEYYDAMMKYQREGKNKHDDAPDATTGVAENMVMVDEPVDVSKTINKFKKLGL